jgi:hypothetical protein
MYQMLEDVGWKDFLKEVDSFCVKNKIKISDMDIFYGPVGRDMKFFIKIKNLHCYRVDISSVSLIGNFRCLMKGLMR